MIPIIFFKFNVEILILYQDDPPLPEDDENKEKRTDDIYSWDAYFLKADQGILFEL